MYTDETRKSELSRAYVVAVAAKAGVVIFETKTDYGVDGIFQAVKYFPKEKRYHSKQACISFQLKATTSAKFEDGFITYPLEAKNYSALVDDSLAPKILILYVMPREEEQWFNVSQDETILRRCAWWCSLEGLPEKPNKNGVTIRIPINQVFTPETLTELFDRVERGAEYL